MEYKAFIGKLFSLADIFLTTIAILLQKNVRTFKEGADLGTFVVIMSYFTIKIIFLFSDEARKERKNKEEQEIIDIYRKDIEEFIKNRKKDENQ